ncbi:MAG: branched-chain amino acid transaminase [Myxococcota bacterium]
MVTKAEKIWFDGEFIPWDDAKVHVLTHTLHYGVGVFEGIRCYKLHDGGSAIFRLAEHIKRLAESAHIVQMPLPWSEEVIMEACIEAVRVNKLDECYIRPLAFVGAGAMGLRATSNPTHLAVVAWPWGSYLGDEGLKQGIRAKVSSFARAGVNSLMAKGKICGHYVNSVLANREALQSGYDEAILLDPQGYVCEASGENIFVVREGRLATASTGASILGGITRNTIFELCEELDLSMEQRLISRDELYIADEVFMVGTAAEVTPVREIDDRSIGTGEPGPITRQIQDRYFEVVRGKNTPERWLSRI